MWNQATCGYEWIKGVDAQADAEEAQIGAPRLPALHASQTRVDTALRTETMKSPLRKSRSLNGRSLSLSSGMRTSLF